MRAQRLMIDLSVRGGESRNLLKESESTKGAAMSGIVDNPVVVFAAFLVAQWIAAYLGDFVRSRRPPGGNNDQNNSICFVRVGARFRRTSNAVLASLSA